MPKVIKLKNDTYLYGTIIEEGSNDYGYWIKYSSGTMICYLDIIVTDQAIDAEYGSLYVGNRTWIFPIEFINDNISVACSCFHWGTGASWGSAMRPSKHGVQLRGFDCYQRPSGTECVIQAIAIGKWK